ncbi:NAD(FAD)-utilizing dehydrogenase [Mogibacterium sp. NSJ-24]|uniref:NAD(FAD)-utilizing dehydrogenase n=1 Tax=Lentihominibacter hominis TaxID=2763645 RepID=A0A926EAE8_9FIRM|nr:NAD(FAD)-utilizing dehydrogenase [Lentihominibacter hominis]MBC8568674.1 NAD(FAD)-utilizing dehydrogenase [Lentihominibacter hominis]
MRYRINQIKLNVGQSRDDIPKAIRKKLRKPELKIYDMQIVKESVDARKKHDIRLVYTVDFSCREKLSLESPSNRDYDSMAKKTGPWDYDKRPVIAGFGPCGMFTALILAEAGKRPVVIERGQSVDERVKSVEKFWSEGVLDPESNVQFGEGGAGTFSDGKLTTGIKDIRISKVLKEFTEAGAHEEILYKQKPHIGTDKLRDIVKNIRHKIESLGGNIFFDTRLDGIITEESAEGRRIKGVKLLQRGAGIIELETDSLVLAIGHSARDTFEMLFREGFKMEQKPFSIGVRIEHLQKDIDRAQYGSAVLAETLGAADYKLNHRCQNGRGVYTFCMCPGGSVINAASERHTAVTNGMSNSDRKGIYANSGLLVDVLREDFPSEHPLAGVEFQRKYERLAYENGKGNLPKTKYKNFRENNNDAVRKSIPEFAAESIIEAMPFFGKKLLGFDSDEAVLTAVETRSSSPVRILRDSDHQSDIKGIFPAGEGPGYAGGIMSAAVDGIKTAEKILNVIFL